jgi:AcrR family transcriptional regulator
VTDNPATHVDGRRARYAHRRPELLAGAISYAMTNGVSDLSMRPLAEQLGVSHATLLHHFKTKEQLLAEIVAEVRRRERPGDSDSDITLADLWRRWSSRQGQQTLRLMFEIYGLALRRPDEFSTFLDHVVTDWLDIIQSKAVADGCPPTRAGAVATVTLAAMRGLLLDLLATQDTARLDSAFDQLDAMLARERATWS